MRDLERKYRKAWMPLRDSKQYLDTHVPQIPFLFGAPPWAPPPRGAVVSGQTTACTLSEKEREEEEEEGEGGHGLKNKDAEQCKIKEIRGDWGKC